MRNLFEEDFHFEIQHFEIPPRLWQTDLFTKVISREDITVQNAS